MGGLVLHQAAGHCVCSAFNALAMSIMFCPEATDPVLFDPSKVQHSTCDTVGIPARPNQKSPSIATRSLGTSTFSHMLCASLSIPRNNDPGFATTVAFV